jgi:hypothetical protein
MRPDPPEEHGGGSKGIGDGQAVHCPFQPLDGGGADVGGSRPAGQFQRADLVA